MLLCIDVGNTNIKLGLFAGEELQHLWRFETERSRLADEYAGMLLNLLNYHHIQPADIEGCVVSSVVPALTREFSSLVEHYLGLKAVVVGQGAIIGMEVNTFNPAEVGTDLIANAVAARHLFGAPVIVVGMGTATTISAVSKNGIFEGVAIAPGLATGSEVMFRVAAQLPMVELAHPPHAIGKSTVHSIQSGLVFGFGALIEGLVKRIQVELGGNARVIATGGLAELVKDASQVIEVVEPNLTLIGLRLIYELNCE